MARQNLGIIRSLTIEITKYVNNSIAVGYPKQYDGKSGFTWNNIEYLEITSDDLAKMLDTVFLNRLNSWKAYVENIESGLKLDTDLDTSFPAYKEDTTTCPVDNPLLILEAVLDCSGDTLTVTYGGGTAPYSISLDNGLTYVVTGTTSTTYIFTGLNAPSYEIMLIDSVGNYYRWEQLSCNLIEVTFVPVFLTNLADGYIVDESLNQYRTGFTISQAAGTTYDTIAFPVSRTSFVGWTSYLPNRNNFGKANYHSPNTGYTHTFTHTETIYGIFIKEEPFSFQFCYFPSSTGYTPTADDYDYYCANCDNETTVYMDFMEYSTYGMVKSVWYSDIELTTVVPYGYYKYMATDTDQTLYELRDGIATFNFICDPTILECGAQPTPTPTPTNPGCLNNRYLPTENRINYWSRNFWNNGPNLDLTNIPLSSLNSSIASYCADAKSYNLGSYGTVFYLEVKAMQVGDPVYKYSTTCELFDKDMTIIFSDLNKKSPCPNLNGRVAIRVESGYIVGMITL